MPPSAYRYAYFDETNDVALHSPHRYFIVAGFVAADSRAIELHVQRARRKLGKAPGRSELKSAKTALRIQERLLKAVAEEEIEIYAVIVDKRAVLRPPKDLEEIYRAAVGRILENVAGRWPRLACYLDKRYTVPTLFDRLEADLREKLADVPSQAVLIREADSQHNKSIQAADFIARAFRQKYELADMTLWKLVAGRIVVEEVLAVPLW